MQAHGVANNFILPTVLMNALKNQKKLSVDEIKVQEVTKYFLWIEANNIRLGNEPGNGMDPRKTEFGENDVTNFLTDFLYWAPLLAKYFGPYLR